MAVNLGGHESTQYRHTGLLLSLRMDPVGMFSSCPVCSMGLLPLRLGLHLGWEDSPGLPSSWGWFLSACRMLREKLSDQPAILLPETCLTDTPARGSLAGA